MGSFLEYQGQPIQRENEESPLEMSKDRIAPQGNVYVKSTGNMLDKVENKILLLGMHLFEGVSILHNLPFHKLRG